MTQQYPTLPHITKQQQRILENIFTYRFLTIKHLQSHLGHTQKYRIQTWLNDLIAKDYIHQDYDSKATLSGAFATYYIAVNGVRYIRTLDRYSAGELRKRYPDKDHSQSYVDHRLLMATICVNLKTSSDDTKTYTWLVQSDFSSLDDELPEAAYLRELRPHLYFTKQTSEETVSYIVEHMHTKLPHARLRSRLKKLIGFESYEWGGEDPSPSTLIMCDELADLIYVKRRARYLIEQYYDDIDLDIRAAVTSKVRDQGVTGKIWEAVS